MRSYLISILAVLVVAGCSSDVGEFSIYFQPYSSTLDEQAHETVAAAANFAQSNPKLPIVLNGFSAPPDPKLDVDGLSAQRADAVRQALVDDGVAPGRMTTVANGITDPKTLPTLAVRRVDISIGPNALPIGGNGASVAGGGFKQ